MGIKNVLENVTRKSRTTCKTSISQYYGARELSLRSAIGRAEQWQYLLFVCVGGCAVCGKHISSRKQRAEAIVAHSKAYWL